MKSNHRRFTIKKPVRKNFAIFTGKRKYSGLFLIKLQAKETPTQLFPCE